VRSFRESYVVTATPRQKPLSLPPQRLAQASDAPAISALMRASVLDLFAHFYDERQTASSAEYIAHLDMQLIEDGTYFVHEAGDEIVACGGWGRRNKLYTGSGSLGDDERLLDPAAEPARVRAMFMRRRLDPPWPWPRDPRCLRARGARGGLQEARARATLPGEPLYRAFGFREIERFTVTMPDGVSVEAVAMERPIEPLAVNDAVSRPAAMDTA
jgi:hypothetical protein